ncbi:hypothetical protein B0H17DRAFT_1190676 [Mycena rosella]|uniref:Uncharacterized protein n=1 Tax=Mycena rosella TaxID=1033263 RepID=A0AAD7H0Y4_MYCRO|nr:hypothetical protein B0H17DRAFT_1190676 [Mycena rosella]
MGLLDHRGLRNPPYAYGWIVPYAQLLGAAAKITGQTPQSLQGRFVNARWDTLGYADKYGRQARPQLRGLYEKRAEAVLVHIATNQSPEVIKFASDNAFRDACRDCLGNPEGVQRDAIWFRVDMEDVPPDYDYEFDGFVGYGDFVGL